MIFIFKKGSSLRLSVTMSIIFWALVCMIFELELYPLAPYTMYSYPFYNIDHQQLELNFVGRDGRLHKTKDFELRPWDEARLKEHFKVLLRQDKNELIQSTLKEILAREFYEGDYVGIRLEKHKWIKMTTSNFKSPIIEVIEDVTK